MEHHFLSCRKDFSPHHLLFHLVYKFQCDRYNSSYYGDDSQSLESRSREHIAFNQKKSCRLRALYMTTFHFAILLMISSFWFTEPINFYQK